MVWRRMVSKVLKKNLKLLSQFMWKTQKSCQWRHSSESRMDLGLVRGIITKSQWKSANLYHLPILPLISKMKTLKSTMKNYLQTKELTWRRKGSKKWGDREVRTKILKPKNPKGKAKLSIKMPRSIIANKDRVRHSIQISKITNRINKE